MALIDLAPFGTHSYRMLKPGGGGGGRDPWSSPNSTDARIRAHNINNVTLTIPGAPGIPVPVNSPGWAWDVALGFNWVLLNPAGFVVYANATPTRAKVIASARSSTAAGSQQVDMFLAHNGASIGAARSRGFPSPTRKTIHFIEYEVDLAFADTLQLFMLNNTSATSILFDQLRLEII